MKVDRLSSLFIYGAEEILSGNSMVYRIRFKESLQLERVRDSYRSLVLARSELRMKFVPDNKAEKFIWEQMSEEETGVLLEKEDQELSRIKTKAELDSEYHETNSRLPVRFALEDEKTLVLIVNHVFTSGRGGIYWFREWLKYYTQDAQQQVPSSEEETVRKPTAIERLPRSIAGVFWTLVYIVSFLRGVGKGADKRTIDLTHGKRCPKNEEGYSAKRYIFSEEITNQFRNRVKAKGHTVSIELLNIVARVFFDMFPQKDRILISIPTDLRTMQPWIPSRVPGNFTGSLIMQLTRSGDLEKQIKREFKWINRGIPYYLPRLMGLMGTEFKSKEHFFSQAGTAIPERAPFENYTLALSNPGKVGFPEMEQHCEWIAGHAKTQTIFLGMGYACGQLSMEVGISNALFNPEEVFGITDKIAAQIEARNPV